MQSYFVEGQSSSIFDFACTVIHLQNLLCLTNSCSCNNYTEALISALAYEQTAIFILVGLIKKPVVVCLGMIFAVNSGDLFYSLSDSVAVNLVYRTH